MNSPAPALPIRARGQIIIQALAGKPVAGAADPLKDGLRLSARQIGQVAKRAVARFIIVAERIRQWHHNLGKVDSIFLIRFESGSKRYVNREWLYHVCIMSILKLYCKWIIERFKPGMEGSPD